MVDETMKLCVGGEEIKVGSKRRSAKLTKFLNGNTYMRARGINRKT